MQSSLVQSSVARVKPFTCPSRPSRQPAVTRVSAQKTSDQQPSNLVLKTVSAVAAAQLALLSPGAAFADQPPPIKAGTDVGEAVQGQIPEGAASSKTREERNTSRDAKIDDKLNTLKDRFDADKIVQGANRGDIFYGGGKDKGVSFGLTAPTLSEPTNSLQVSVSEKLSQAASGAAADAGQAVKNATSNTTSSDPLAAAKNAASDAADAAKKAANKLPGQGVDTKPVSYSGSSLQVNVANQVNVGVDPVEQTKAAAQEAAASVKSQTGNNPLESLKNKIDEAAVTSNSPQVQLDQAGNKAQQLKQQATTHDLWSGNLQHSVTFTPVGNSLFLADTGNASLLPRNEGGVSQGQGGEYYASGKGNAVQGGDLKDSIFNENAAQNKPSDVGRTAAQQDAAPRNEPKKQSGLPSVLGGDSLVRDDSETPEDVAKGNLAKAQQSSDNAFDTLKSKLGL